MIEIPEQKILIDEANSNNKKIKNLSLEKSNLEKIVSSCKKGVLISGGATVLSTSIGGTLPLVLGTLTVVGWSYLTKVISIKREINEEIEFRESWSDLLKKEVENREKLHYNISTNQIDMSKDEYKDLKVELLLDLLLPSDIKIGTIGNDIFNKYSFLDSTKGIICKVLARRNNKC